MTISVRFTSFPEILQILGASRVTWRFHTENPKFYSDLSVSLLYTAFCLVHVNRQTFLCEWEGGRDGDIVIMLKILGTTVQNLATWATKCLGFVQHWHSFKLIEFVENFSVHKNTKHKILLIFNFAVILGVLCSKKST